MTVYYNYSSNESLERIYHVLNGDTVPSSMPTTEGEQAWNTSLARIAQLLEGTLTDLHSPLDQYAEIWTWTGTVLMTGLTANIFNKITGTFQNNGNYLTAVPHYENDNILVTDTGSVYLIEWHADVNGLLTAEYAIEPYVNAVGVPQAVSRVKPSASGTSTCMSGIGVQYISGTSIQVDLRVNPEAATWIQINSAQLFVRKLGPRANEGTNNS
jgi:hypothetical protein